MIFHMSTDTPDSLPLSVEVPEWGERSEMVEVQTGKGTLRLVAMTPDDVYVEGELHYRGHTYEVRYRHTNDAGEPKGYYYSAEGGQVHGVLPGPGVADWARADFFSPRAPKTYVEPLLDCVKAAVIKYRRDHAAHAAQSRANSIRQDLNRKATTYNERAKAAAEALAECQALRADYNAAMLTVLAAGKTNSD
jgi:hypothetical protein